jgi:F0F1-type ATP synthase beta subunit
LPFTGLPVIYFEFCLSTGELDHVPEVAFFMVGGIEEVVAKAERLAREQN